MVLYEPRTSPSGQLAPVALLSLSAPVAFSDGVQKVIPFDRVTFTKGDAGTLLDPPLAGALTFACGPGLYLVQCQVRLSVTVDSLEATIGSDDAQNIVTQVASTGAIDHCTWSGTFLFPASKTPVSPTVFAALGASITGTGAGGNIDTAQLLILPIYGFDR